MRILVVEDDISSLEYIKAILGRYKHQYDTVGNGELAFEYFKLNNYDTILMDIRLPKLSGIDATKLIRGYEKENRLARVKIVVTSATDSSTLSSLLTVGFDSYLSKPFNIKDLLGVLSEPSKESN